jgi:chemotaxis protein MotB
MATETPASPEGVKARPVIVIKRKAPGHAGRHGGAWKVAYADFVTALMALFIVLWLMGSDEELKKAVANYFNNPNGPGKMAGTSAAGLGNAIEIPKEDMGKLREKLQEALKAIPNFHNLKDHVEITITADGLRIELLENEAGIFFESGKPVPTETGSQLLSTLAFELGKLPNSLMIEGHTDSKPYSGDASYSNWELSADRANSARKIMQANGLRTDQVGQVRGFADRQLRHPDDPENASNRRISVIVQYLPTTPAADKPDPAAKGGGGTKAAEATKSGGNPAEAAKPSNSAKPTQAAKPAEAAKPPSSAKPTEATKPPVNVTPTATTKPPGSAKPAATTTKPLTPKPTEPAKPPGNAKPTTTGKLPSAAKPAATTTKPPGKQKTEK